MRRLERVKVIAREIAYFQFAILLNPDNRASNFQFDKHDIGHHVRISIFSYFEYDLSEKELDIAQEEASNVWRTQIETSNVLGWIDSIKLS